MSAGERPPPVGRYPADGDNPLAALIDQMQQNWDLGDNIANDDLVIRIREHIREQRLQAEVCSVDRAAARPGDLIGPYRDRGTGAGGDMAGGRWLPEHTQAVADDVDYWSRHGVHVVSIRPRVDGCGAVIGVRRLTNHIAVAMQQRYSFPVYCWDAPPP